MIARTVLGLSLFICAAMPVAAQTNGGEPTTSKSSIGFGPQIGYYNTNGSDGGRIMGGVALRLKLSDALGVEGSINYREEKFANGAIDVKSWPVMVTGLLYPIPVVYGAIGAGWYNTTIDYNIPSAIVGGSSTVASETVQQFGWHFGGGLELPLGTVGKLVGDIRYVFLNYNFKTFPGSNGVNSNFYVITVGLLFGL